MKIHSLIILIFIVSFRIVGDSPAMPIPYVEPSWYGSFYFKMIPEKGSYDNKSYKIISPAYGVAYELSDDGISKELWKIEGWYAFKVFLSNNGQNLIRMGNH